VWFVQVAQIIICVTMVMCDALVAAPVAAMLHSTHENMPMGSTHEYGLEDAYNVCP